MCLRNYCLIIVVLSGWGWCAQAEEQNEPKVVMRNAGEKTPKEGYSVLHNIIMYLPDRVFDLLDIFRVRVEVGPGLSAGVRATTVAQVYLGSHASIYGGLPGPRRKVAIPLPVGLESHYGATLSILDATVDGGIGPNYSPTEIGVSIHPVIVGVDIGIDPVEILDFAAGLIGFDIRDDDL